MKREFIFLVTAALIQPTLAFAQKQQALATIGLKCADFHKNDDGTWSAVHTVTVPAGGTRFSISPKQILGPDTRVMAYPLGVMVNTECGGHSSTNSAGAAPR